jgi:hypothetical protein
MPITGLESTLEALLVNTIKAGIAARCGVSPLTPNCIDGLAKGIADAIIPFLVANVQVNTTTVPGAGLIDSMSGPVSGTANTDPGTIS